jgi:hypothetical protein
MRARGVGSSPTQVLQTLAAASLSPLVCWSLHPRAFSIEPLHKTIIAEPSPLSPYTKQSSSIHPRPSIQTFSRDLRRWTFSGRAFVGGPSPTRPSPRDLLPSAFSRRPSPTGLCWETFSLRPSLGDLLPSAFCGRPSPVGPL